MRPPLIGITEGTDPRKPGFYVIRPAYLRSVEIAGGIPVVLAPSGPALHPSLVDRLDGLLVTGGVDIAPRVYGEEAHAPVDEPSGERDEFETALVGEALERTMPVLGICRGCQLLNVVFGGTLVQDVPSETGTVLVHGDFERPPAEAAHEVFVQEGSRLASILGPGPHAVNSFHHQAVKRLGTGLVASAWASDGVIEAIEHPGYPFVVGVQWHPEAFWDSRPDFRPLFGAFVAAAAARAAAQAPGVRIPLQAGPM